MDIDRLKELTRPILAGILTISLCAGFFLGKISSNEFVPVVIMAVSYWYTAARSQPGNGQ